MNIKIDSKQRYASGRDALNFLGYKNVGTHKMKTVVKDVFAFDGKLFTISKCVIERYQVKLLQIKTFNGALDNAPIPEPDKTEV